MFQDETVEMATGYWGHYGPFFFIAVNSAKNCCEGLPGNHFRNIKLSPGIRGLLKLTEISFRSIFISRAKREIILPGLAKGAEIRVHCGYALILKGKSFTAVTS